MAEQTFRSPGFFDSEIDASARQEQAPSGTPAGIIGTSDKGPAFVPTTVRTFGDFEQKFGGLNPKKFAPYAANEFLKNRTSLTFLRVLGAGANATTTDISNTLATGQVKNAGFVLTGTQASATDLRHKGSVQFLVARHSVATNEAYGLPMFTDNDSFTTGAPIYANMVRGMILMASGARMMVLDGNEAATSAFTATGPDDAATISSDKFKLVISSSNGSSYATTDGNAGVRIYTASLNPSNSDYYAKILNTDPEKFAEHQHVLYADFAVDNEVASVTNVAVVSGSSNTSTVSGNTSMLFREAFGHFDTRYTTPRTSWFISQPFGSTEYDLFHFETIDDGEVSNTLYKISISNLKVSTDPQNPYGTFTVLVRKWEDSDTEPKVLEQYPNCSLNPRAANYVARLIGDRKVSYNFDAESDSEQRLVTSGKYANKSKYVRLVMSDMVENGLVPQTTLPFGFRGPEVLKTNDGLTDTSATGARRLAGVLGTSSLSGSLVPPIPFRYKVTRGDTATSGFAGNPGTNETVNASYYWGVKFERNTSILNPNTSAEKNELLKAYAKFAGIKKLDTLVTGSGADTLNNNKFTLSRVALSVTSVANLTASLTDHMKEAVYIRNGTVDPSTYAITDATLGERLTLASLLAQTSSVDFNRFNQYAKFTNFMYGGFDGVNILDKNARRMNDKSTSFDSGGGAESAFVSPGLGYNTNGTGTANNSVASYVVASKIMTDPMTVNHNILTIPGIREPYVTDYALRQCKEYGLSIFLMDLVSYDEDGNRIYDDSTDKPDVNKTVNSFEARAVDNNYGATYFPDVFIDDDTNKRKVKVPASVAALAAVGFNDRVAYPWFAPAGFNRAALDFVTNVSVRLNKDDKDRLHDARINPIASLPRQGYVIFGQKTLQQAKSALDRVNVRRLLLEVKRQVTEIAFPLVFEQNIPANRDKFVNEAVLRLGLIQSQAGIEQFRVIMDDTNNSDDDRDLNRLNGTIRIVPTRTIEYIAVDFIITNNGVQFI